MFDDAPVIDAFVSLFRGRGDAYGSWDGGCVRKPLDRTSFENHLMGEELIGVYPLVPFEGAFGCVWGCSDIDVDDLDAARNLQLAFFIKNIVAHIEKTVKGYHIWVFADGLVPASTMRRAFLAAHQAINYPAKEVNPKQENPGKGFGNYVRLPYPGELRSPSDVRYMLEQDGQPMGLRTWHEYAMKHRTSRTKLDAIASLYTPPHIHTIDVDTPSEDVKYLLTRVDAVSYIIWRDGPYPGSDRSNTLYRLAHRLVNTSLTPTEAFSVLRNADKRWGKFHMRSDGDNELLKMINHAYGVK
jgi:hypothetical protein